jgi:hypothetical protein
VLRGAKLVRVAEDIGGKLSFHDCTLLLTRKGRAPYILRCVAEIVTANGWKTFIPVSAHARDRHLGSGIVSECHTYEAARTLGVPEPLS